MAPARLAGPRGIFDKTGLKLRRTGKELSVRHGRPLDIDYDAPPTALLATVVAGIGEA